MSVVTRFAPSPTGDLHVGGARTALFNYLLAKHYNGEFVLRIEDTDQDRNKDSSVKTILYGLGWLGLTHDVLYYQSHHKEAHTELAHKLVAAGKAYYCYMTPQELLVEKTNAEAEKRAFKYDRRWREGGLPRPVGVTPVIRLKVPVDGSIGFTDIVRGELSINNSELDDFIILRSDGSPVYHLAVVADDIFSGITHVVRGEDHITNTFKQIHLYNAIGVQLPTYAHIPLIHGEDGKKLSKRNGAVSVLDFKEQGFLPEAVANYLAGLGWGFCQNGMTMKDLIEKFDIHQVGSSPSQLDNKKRLSLNHDFMQKLDWYDAFELCGFHHNQHCVFKTRFEKMFPELITRANTIVELKNSALFLDDHPDFDDSAKAVLSKDINIIEQFVSYFTLTNDFHHFPEKYDIKLKDAAIAVRAALCGSKISSGSINAIIDALGEEEVLTRLKKAIEVFSNK